MNLRLYLVIDSYQTIISGRHAQGTSAEAQNLLIEQIGNSFSSCHISEILVLIDMTSI